MKITLIIATTVLVLQMTTFVRSAPASIDPVNAAADSSSLPDATRIKRSGFEIVSHIQKSVISGIGQASASSAGHLSASGSGSSSGHSSSSSHNSHPVEPPYQPHEPKFDGWQLKKSILNTLFQAVKAITGGVTALKGQLIKGSGYLVSAKGKLIAAGGEAVTNVGKKIASSANLVHKSPSSHFAKFSAPLSGASSSSSSHPSSSSSSSSHSGHGQSYSSVEGPSYSHTAPGSSYGPPPPSTLYLPSAPSHHTAPAHTGHSGPASYSYGPPPSSHSSISYKSPITSYGQHVETKYGPPEVHYKQVNDYTKITTGPGPSGGSSSSYHGTGHNTKPKSVVQAAEVLRQILKNSPPQTEDEHDSHYDTHSDVHYHDHPAQVQHHYSTGHKLIDQYDIPNDPIPPFRPIKSHAVYGVPVGNIESVTHAQSIITSYGAPPSGSASSHNHYPTGEESPAYSVYRQMSLKLGGHAQPSLSAHLTPPSGSYDNTAISSPGDEDDNHLHETHLNELKRTLGEQIEVQKSLTYEFQDQPHLVKRSDDPTPKKAAGKDTSNSKLKSQSKSVEKLN